MNKAIDDLEKAAMAEASLHFNKKYGHDSWWACVCTFKAGHEYAQQQLAPSSADAELARQRYFDENSKDWDKVMYDRYGWDLSHDADRFKEGYEQALKDVAKRNTPTQNVDNPHREQRMMIKKPPVETGGRMLTNCSHH